MTAFHFHLHASPESTSLSDDGFQSLPSIQFNGHDVAAWNIAHIERYSMAVSFEEVEQSMSQLPRMFFEMDGSFVWRGQYGRVQHINSSERDVEQSWQIDGMVYDVAGRVSRVELKGDCQLEQFQELVERLQPAESLVAYLIDQSCFVRVVDLMRAWQ